MYGLGITDVMLNWNLALSAYKVSTFLRIVQDKNLEEDSYASDRTWLPENVP